MDLPVTSRKVSRFFHFSPGKEVKPGKEPKDALAETACKALRAIAGVGSV